MRRGSFIGPILLIVIGGLFLLNNLRPEMPLLDLLAAYWPYLLIAWGVLRLIEILIWAMQSRPLPRAGISGGEWTLVVLICLAGTTTDFAKSHWPHTRFTMRGMEIFGEAYDFQAKGSQPATDAKRILVENLHGNVRIAGTDIDEVRVESRTTVRAFERSQADDAYQQCPLEVISRGDQIVIRTNQERLSSSEAITTDLEISVPKGVSVEGRARTGDFDITNISGDIDIESNNAGVRLSEIDGSARINLDRSDIIRVINLKGTIQLEGRGRDVELENIGGLATVNGTYSGELLFRNLAEPLQLDNRRLEFRVAKAPGQIRIALRDLTGSDLEGPIYLKTRSHDIRFSDFTNELVIETERGDIELRPGKTPLARMTVETESGDIDLALPESNGFGLLVKTNRGNVINDFGPVLVEEADGRGAILKGPEGREPSIEINTNSGTVTVRKASGTPAPSHPQSRPSPSVSL